MDKAALLALADRVEALTGPDREVDASIWLACAPGATRKELRYFHKASGTECVIDETRDASRRLIIVPEYTASLDAAMMLVPEGWEAAIYCAPVGSKLNANVQIETEAMRQAMLDFYPIESIAATSALALTAAALRARAAS